MVEAKKVNNESIFLDKFYPVNKKALVVGIFNYEQCQPLEGEGKLDNLTHPQRDAKAMEEFLKSHEYEVTSIIQKNPGDQIKALEVHAVLEQFLQEAENNNYDRILDPMHYFIYFSGHGCISDDTSYTSGIDSEGNLIWFEHYAIRFSSVTECVVFSLLDCCRDKSKRKQFTEGSSRKFLPKVASGISVLKFSCNVDSTAIVKTTKFLSTNTDSFLERAKLRSHYDFSSLLRGFNFLGYYNKQQKDWGQWYLFCKNNQGLDEAIEEKGKDNIPATNMGDVQKSLDESIMKSHGLIDESNMTQDYSVINPQDQEEEEVKIIEEYVLEAISYDPKISNSFKFSQYTKTMKVIMRHDENHIIVAGEQNQFYLLDKQLKQTKTKSLKLKEVKCAILIEGYAYFATKTESDNKSEMGIEVFKVTDLDNEGQHSYFKTGSIIAKMLILSEGVLLCAGAKGLIEFADYYKCRMLTYNPQNVHSQNIRFQLKDVSLLLDIQKTQNENEYAIITMEKLIFARIPSDNYDCLQYTDSHEFDYLIRGFLHIKDDQYAFFFNNEANLFIYDRNQKDLTQQIINHTNCTGFISMRFLQNVGDNKYMGRYLILKDQQGLSLFDLHKNKSVLIKKMECLNVYYEENALCSFFLESQLETMDQQDFHFKILTLENDKVGNQSLIEVSLHKPEQML